MIDLGTLGGTNSYAFAVTDTGQVVGNSNRAEGSMHAFFWTQAAGMIDLGTLGGRNSFAASVNGAGQVVGFSEMASFTLWQHAFS